MITMKCFLSTIIWFLFLSPVLSFASDYREQLLKDVASLDDNLNSIYQELKINLNPTIYSELKDSQIKWIKFKEQTCKFESKFTSRNPLWFTETTDDGQSLVCIKRLTSQRLDSLRKYLSQHQTVYDDVNLSRHKPYIKNCKLVNLPADYEVYAVGTYSGPEHTDIQLGDSGHLTRQASVIVNRPFKPVVLVLMGYNPIIWNVKHTKNTLIIAVVMAGVHKQALLGIPRETTKLFAIDDDIETCKYFYAYEPGSKEEKALSRIEQITGKKPETTVFRSSNKIFYIGDDDIDPDSLRFSSEIDISEYVDLKRTPIGDKGFEQLIAQGKIRLSTQNEIDAWLEKAKERFQAYNIEWKGEHDLSPGSVYTVIERFELPAGIRYKQFIIPENQSAPTYQTPENSFYFLENGTCNGSSPECNVYP